jgi:hypothetical protein
MPLFFLIAAGLGAFTVGATTVDASGVAKKNEQARVEQSAPVQRQAYTVDTSASTPVVTYQPTDK